MPQEAITKDAFGEEIKTKEEKEQPTEKSIEKPEGGEKVTPTQQIAELSRKIGIYEAEKLAWNETNKSKDENIRAMKKSIKALEEQLKNNKGGGDRNDDEGNLFKDIKTSKDLTQDQKDEMTEAEIKQMDEIAALKQGINKLAGLMAKGKKEKTDDTDIQGLVKNTAQKLADGNTEMANQIIESVQQFNLNDLSEEDIVSMVGKAATLVPTYKPPKEQPTGNGGRAAGGANDADPYGVNKIVDEVHARKDEKGFSL